jgi:acetolactate synthase-1/2/3 large subunit
MPTVADLIVRRLLNAGVRTLAGMPGGGSNIDLVEAAGRAGLPFVLSHTETAGALVAAAQAELTGRPGACLATLGPGVASIVNGAAHARLDRVPLLIFTDSLPATARDVFLHQRLDHGAVLGPVTKASFTLDCAGAEDTLDRALDIALEPPPGPVHLDCAPDVSQHAVSMDSSAPSAPVPSGPRHGLATSGAPERLISRARRPLAIVGLGAREPAAAAWLTLSERHGIPAMVTYKAKGVVPDDHPCFAGVFTHGAPERPLIEAADLLLGVGLDPVEILPRAWTYDQPFVACGRWLLDQQHLPVASWILGEIPDALQAIEAWLPASNAWPDGEAQAHARRQRAAFRVDTSGWAPYRVVETAARVLGPDAQVTVDAGAHMFPVMALWPARRPRQILISNGLSTMGFAVPAAIGAGMLDRGRRVTALTGDGGLLMCLAELATLARERLPVTVIVFNDRSLSLIRIKQERLGYRPAGVSLDGIEWTTLAAAFGVPACRAASDAELERVLAGASTLDGPLLVDAPIDPGGYQDTLRAARG